MSRAHLIYPFEGNIKRELQRLSKDHLNGKIVLRYYKVRKTRVKLATMYNDLSRLNVMSKIFKKRFEEATIPDIENLISDLDDKYDNPSTYNKHCSILKEFYRWLKGYPQNELPPIVRWIRRKRIPITTVKEKDLHPLSEIIKMSQKTTDLRLRAFIQNKVDGACRVGELLTARIGDIQYTKYGAEIACDGKTGDDKPIILSWSTGLLTQWLNMHPFRDDPDSPIYPAQPYDAPKYWQYTALRKAFKKCARDANITKRMWLHLLKHIGCTEDVKNKMPDHLRKYKHHHSKDSKMDAVYVHLSRSIVPDIQRYSFEENEIPNNEDVKEESKRPIIKICHRCQYSNPADSIYCNRCSAPLEFEKASQMAIQNSRVSAFLEKISNMDTDKLEKIEKIISENV